MTDDAARKFSQPLDARAHAGDGETAKREAMPSNDFEPMTDYAARAHALNERLTAIFLSDEGTPTAIRHAIEAELRAVADEARREQDHASRLLAKSLTEEMLRTIADVWGNTNAAVLRHWRDEVLAAIQPGAEP